MNTFDPNLPGVATGSYFALPYSKEEAHTVLISVPWDVTTSYRPGTHLGPQAIIDASIQVDLFNVRVPRAWSIPWQRNRFMKNCLFSTVRPENWPNKS